MNKPLTKEQIKNWRKLLKSLMGSFADHLTEEEIEKMRTTLQRKIYTEDLIDTEDLKN